MDSAEFIRGRDPSASEEIAHFIGDQPEALELIVSPNNGLDQTPHEDQLLNAELGAITIALGGLVLTAGVKALPR